MDEDKFVTICVLFMVLSIPTTCTIITYNSEITEREYIKHGYQECPQIGSSTRLWQKKCNLNLKGE